MADQKSKLGRPKLIPTPEDFWGLFEDYRDATKANPFKVNDFAGKDGNEVERKKERCLTMEGFENWLEDCYGIGQVGQYLENRDGRYSDFVAIVSRVRREIRQDQIEGGMAQVFAQNLTARLNNLTEKTESKVQNNVQLLSFDPLVPEEKKTK